MMKQGSAGVYEPGIDVNKPNSIPERKSMRGTDSTGKVNSNASEANRIGKANRIGEAGDIDAANSLDETHSVDAAHSVDALAAPAAVARTPDLIAAEIAAIKQQTGRILLASAIEIGRRLIEVKDKIPYGEFGVWLGGAVQYSESTAYRLMRIAEEYGSGLPGCAGAESGPPAKLSYTQALILLGLPAEERAEFIAQTDLENMAVRDLQQAVRDKNKALADKAALQQQYNTLEGTVTELRTELHTASTEAQERQLSLWAEQANSTKLRRELELFKDESAAAQHIAEIKREHKIAQTNLSMARADARFDLISKGCDDLLAAIKELSAADPEAFGHFLKQTNHFATQLLSRLRRLEREHFGLAAKSGKKNL